MDIGRSSRQREVIYKVLKGTTSHPDADWIYSEVRKDIPNISLGTVYRNLAKMVKEKEIIKLETEDNSLHYDARVEAHYHIMCRCCGRIDDIFAGPFSEVEEAAAKVYGGIIEGHSLMFYGKCPECAEKTNEKL